jgi:hypothetical protein
VAQYEFRAAAAVHDLGVQGWVFWQIRAHVMPAQPGAFDVRAVLSAGGKDDLMAALL